MTKMEGHTHGLGLVDLSWHCPGCNADMKRLVNGMRDVECVHPGCGLPDRLHGAPDGSRVTHSTHEFEAPPSEKVGSGEVRDR